MTYERFIEVFANSADLFHGGAEEWARVGRAAIGGQGRFTVGLSGGSTPRDLYSVLATSYSNFPWERVYLFFGDERHVGPENAESNYRMVKETLLDRVTIPAENVFRVEGENPDAKKVAADYEARIRHYFALRENEFPRFDLILLGLGADGHTASLFPDSAALEEKSRLVLANWVAKLNTFRITFTFPVIDHAAEVIFLVKGAEKAGIVRQVIESKDVPTLPAQRIELREGKLLWMLDEAAAEKLTR